MNDAQSNTDPSVSGSSSSLAGGASPEKKRVGVLSLHNSKETKAILNAVEALGHRPVWIREENVSSWIANGTVRVSPEVDVLLNRLLVTKSERPLEDLQLASIYGESVPVLNPPCAVQRAIHKYRSGIRLAAAGLPVPDAYFGRSTRRFEEWTEPLSGDAAHKRTIGTNGQQMSMVSEDDFVNPKIENEQAFVQEFVETDSEPPFDVRVYVVGDEIVGAMRRHAPEGDWRTNVALGGDVEDVTEALDEEAARIAIEATDVLDLDYSGVDLIPAGDEWRILEVNATAGFKGLFSATGSSPAPWIATLAIERVGGSVDPALVRELAATLDDSVPDCKPSLAEEPSGDDVLGYTNRVRISGNSGIETVVAKADTGAKRTSVDATLAGEIGAGPLVGTTEVRSGTRAGTETRPLVDIDVCVNEDWRTVTASVTDRSDLTYPLLLGRDVLEAYTLDIGERVEE